MQQKISWESFTTLQRPAIMENMQHGKKKE